MSCSAPRDRITPFDRPTAAVLDLDARFAEQREQRERVVQAERHVALERVASGRSCRRGGAGRARCASSSARVQIIVALTSSGTTSTGSAGSRPRRRSRSVCAAAGSAADVVLDDSELAPVEDRPQCVPPIARDPLREIARARQLGAVGPRPDEQQGVGARAPRRAAAARRRPATRRRSRRAFSARFSTSPSTVLTPTSSTSGCARRAQQRDRVVGIAADVGVDPERTVSGGAPRGSRLRASGGGTCSRSPRGASGSTR